MRIDATTSATQNVVRVRASYSLDGNASSARHYKVTNREVLRYSACGHSHVAVGLIGGIHPIFKQRLLFRLKNCVSSMLFEPVSPVLRKSENQMMQASQMTPRIKSTWPTLISEALEG